MRRAGWVRQYAIAILLLALLQPSFHAHAATVGTGNCVQTVGSATGITVTTYSDRCVVKFTSTTATTWTVPRGVTKIWVLVVAGGGGGGSDEGGGGGGGGYIENENFAVTSQSVISLDIGAGGAAGTVASDLAADDGEDSTFSSLTAIGGGGGGSAINMNSTQKNGRTGGSGGGGAGESAYTLGTAGARTSGQGFAGGAGYSTRGGGGGGAAEAGNTDGTGLGGDGNGTTILNGASTSYFAGGGGGGGGNSATGSVSGGIGGGGVGGGGASYAPGAGSANTGGGGGGAGASPYADGAAGGSGIIVVNYQFDITAATITSSTTVTIVENTSTATTILTIKASESATMAIALGSDSADFVLTYSDSITSLLKFALIPDYENPQDGGGNNIYDFTLNLVDYSGNISTQAFSITVTDANESSSISPPTISGTAYKGVTLSVSVTLNAPGRVLFTVNGKRIPNCHIVPTTGSYPSFTATCQWKPAVTGGNYLRARLTPTSNTYEIKSSESTHVLVVRRATTR